MELSTKRIRELIACPQFGDDHYGEWGCLAYDQRKAILHLVETIDRQQAEIADERATKELCAEVIKRLVKESETTRSEAIKEFAEKLKEMAYPQHGGVSVVHDITIDNLVKEMTEEKK